MKRSFPWEEQVDVSSHDSSSSNSSNGPHATPIPTIDISLPDPQIQFTSQQDVLIRQAEMYQDYMKQIPIPSHRGSVIPFTSWTGLGRSIKQLYGQPLHYLTNVLLMQWDQLRIGSDDEYKPLDNIIHPCKAEATIWLIEEVHRQTSSHVHIARLWKVDPLYHGFVDSIFPTLDPTS